MTFRIQKNWRWLVALGAVFVPGIVSGALSLPFTFSAGTPIKAADVNANFEALRARLDSIDTTTTPTPVTIGTLNIPGILTATPIRKFSQSIVNATDPGAATGTGSAAPQFSVIEIVRDLGAGTPALVQAASTAAVQKTVSVVIGNLTVKLTNASIVAVKAAPAVGLVPQEVIDLDFMTIQWTYAPTGQPALTTSWDRPTRTGGGSAALSLKYGHAPVGVTLDPSFTPYASYAQSTSCGTPSTNGGTCAAKLTYGPVVIKKGVGAEVVDELSHVLSARANTVDLQWFTDATTLNNRMKLTNASVSGVVLSTNPDGSFADTVSFNWQQADWLVGTTIATVNRSTTGA